MPLSTLFLDTEFTGLHQGSSLISLALVAETGEEFYAEFTDYKQEDVSEWIQLNVVNKLILTEERQLNSLKRMHILGNKEKVKVALIEWLNQFEKKTDPEGKLLPSLQIWADVPHYDWVLFCELFGGALYIPKQIHYMCLDLATLLSIQGKNGDRLSLLREVGIELNEEILPHNALFDAKVGLKCLKKYK